MLRFIFSVALGLVLFMGQALAGVNVNTASAGELETLPGIGPSKATAIIEYRTANGPFASLSDLDSVPGIGPATLTNISSQVEFGKGEPAAAASSASGDDASSAPAAPAATGGGGGVNINSASQGELETLPGIGPSKASAIIEYRTANGPFASCSDLQRVTGIGPATVSQLSSACAVK